MYAFKEIKTTAHEHRSQNSINNNSMCVCIDSLWVNRLYLPVRSEQAQEGEKHSSLRNGLSDS